MSRQGQVGKRRDREAETRQVTSESATPEEKHKAHTDTSVYDTHVS